MPKRKILTITIEFELGDRKTHSKRVQAVYDAAVESAVAAATSELLEDGLTEVRHRMTFDYRWAEQSSTTPIGDAEEWVDGEPA